jgi:hypothetical protein
MQEGIHSLMQMAKLTGALGRCATRGAVRVGLHRSDDGRRRGVDRAARRRQSRGAARADRLRGPRVVAQTLNEELPEGFQRAEFLLAHGMLDAVVERRDLRRTLARLLACCRRPRPRPCVRRGSRGPPRRVARRAPEPAWRDATSPRSRGSIASKRKHGIDLKLERVRRAAAALGHPERAAPTCHVAGTNGKGSTAAMLAAMLGAAGRRVGLYTSPHLVSFRERITIAGTPISEAEVVAGVARIRDVLGAAFDLTCFEVMTLLAWSAFAARGSRHGRARGRARRPASTRPTS